MYYNLALKKTDLPQTVLQFCWPRRNALPWTNFKDHVYSSHLNIIPVQLILLAAVHRQNQSGKSTASGPKPIGTKRIGWETYWRTKPIGGQNIDYVPR
jgi:hypothetical protein